MPEKIYILACKRSKKSIRKKHTLYNAYLTNPSPLNFKLYSSFRNKLHHLLRIAKRRHYETQFIEFSNDMKNTRSLINELMNSTPSDAPSCQEFQGEQDNLTLTEPVKIAEGFNEYFVNVGPSLADSIPHSSVSFPFIQTPPEQFRFGLIEKSEVQDVISKLKF